MSRKRCTCYNVKNFISTVIRSEWKAEDINLMKIGKSHLTLRGALQFPIALSYDDF